MTVFMLTDVKIGDRIVADGGFTCIAENAVLEVKSAPSGDLYVDCDAGRHYLSGQENEDGRLIGFYRKPKL